MSMLYRKPITEAQKKLLLERTKPAQDDINQAANDLIWLLMQRVDKLESETNEKIFSVQPKQHDANSGDRAD